MQQKAARLGFGLIKNHAFIDGNKRIGAHATLVFLALNRIELKYTQEELSDTILKIASKELSFEEFYNGY
ncbi:type II toxin-antitoxin system death-on-curing family toxin [Anaerostipes caccae]|uniref:type II toxin-antitoxin system death-on-curing family toxin n=1 Tax=Anaerostipes caccae TaxID=105841 RepID=UPI002D776C8F|nr:type II toxin-antitoxin system death-on-curing family toxin [Anaerostipes caccae]